MTAMVDEKIYPLVYPLSNHPTKTSRPDYETVDHEPTGSLLNMNHMDTRHLIDLGNWF